MQTQTQVLLAHTEAFISTKNAPQDLFCEHYAYVVLGHNHNALSLDGGRIQYSGSPVSTSEKRVFISICFKDRHRF